MCDKGADIAKNKVVIDKNLKTLLASQFETVSTDILNFRIQLDNCDNDVSFATGLDTDLFSGYEKIQLD